jgi:hypothetical protein
MIRRGISAGEVRAYRTLRRPHSSWCTPQVNLVRQLLVALALVAVAPLALADGPDATLAVGLGWFAHEGDAGRQSDPGVALGLRIDGRVAPRVGLGLSFTWGLMDFDRGAEYIAAGNRAGTWTTDQFAKVERWATKKDTKGDTQPLRFFGAMFADLFLAMSYAAVPFCYVASAGGATSYLQLDGTVSVHLSEQARRDGWVELGLGAAALPMRYVEWRGAYGPVIGTGMRFGNVRLGVRALWSPPGLNEAPRNGTVVAGAATVGFTL